MKKIKYLLLFCIFISSITNSQNKKSFEVSHQEWLEKTKINQFEFLKNYSTVEYLCEIKTHTSIDYSTRKNKWEINKSSLGMKSFLKIIKSDDIKDKIDLCSSEDTPQSTDSKLNKYFCIIEKIPDYGTETNRKCLLDIYDSPLEKKVHTLRCNGYDFIFEGNKFFKYGPTSIMIDVETLGNKKEFNNYSQSVRSGDCLKTSK